MTFTKEDSVECKDKTRFGRFKGRIEGEIKMKNSNYKPLFPEGYRHAVSARKGYRINKRFCLTLKVRDTV